MLSLAGALSQSATRVSFFLILSRLITKNSCNSRVVSWFGQCFLPEPSGSGVWLFVLRRNPADSAVCAKHYPHDIWLYLLASEWTNIAEEEPFVGRCGDAEDELGSRIIAARLVQSLMRLCFLMEKEYVPYSKWFGTALAQLRSAKELTPLFHKIISSENWKEREKYLSKAYESIAHMHNNLKITKPLKVKVTEFYDRPYLVINGGIFARHIKKTDKEQSHSAHKI